MSGDLSLHIFDNKQLHELHQQFLLIDIRCPAFFSLIFLTTSCLFGIIEN